MQIDTNPDKTIPERLREYADSGDVDPMPELLHEAADAIEELTAEVSRLRGLLDAATTPSYLRGGK